TEPWLIIHGFPRKVDGRALSFLIPGCEFYSGRKCSSCYTWAVKSTQNVAQRLAVRSHYAAFCLSFSTLLAASALAARANDPVEMESFHKEVRPILAQFCISCHDSELKKGGIALDQDDALLLDNRELWWKVLKMVRADMMPPRNKPHPKSEQIDKLVG